MSYAEHSIKRTPGVRERSARVIRLKEELNKILELVVHSRESLENELGSEFAQKKLSIDKAFLLKLKELTACYNSLTASRIALDKSEKAMEKEMTPAEEVDAVITFIASLDNQERGNVLRKMIDAHLALVHPNAKARGWLSELGGADAIAGE